MARREIRFSGFGGQGIILAGYITGKAAAIYDGKNATLTQSYGPESRGGASAAMVVISDKSISYPKITVPDVAVLMSQEAYDTYANDIKEGGTILIDEDLVHTDSGPAAARLLRIPATRLAEEELGRKVVANTIMLGALAATTDLVSADALRQAVLSSVKKGTEGLNEKAFERGRDYARELDEGRRQKDEGRRMKAEG